MNQPQIEKRKFQIQQAVQLFFPGFAGDCPIAITVYAVYSVVSFIDNQMPIFTARDADGKIYVQNYGLGFVIVIVAIILIGYLSSFFIKNRMFNLFDSVCKTNTRHPFYLFHCQRIF